MKPLWDKNKGKLYCLLGKKLSIDGFCPPKPEEEKKNLKDEKKPKPPAKKQYTDESCIACLYVMEKLERIVARNPMDGEPAGPNNQNSFPGPASYNPAAYNAAQDVNLAAPIPGPGYNSGMFLQVGEAVKCPPGMPFCRKALYRTGRRGAEREIARLQNQGKQKALEADLDDGLRKIAGAMPPHYHPVIHNLQVRVAQVANQYLHDYSNEEICVDTSMCFAALLGTALVKCLHAFDNTGRLRKLYNYIQNWYTIKIFFYSLHSLNQSNDKNILSIFSRSMLLRVYLAH